MIPVPDLFGSSSRGQLIKLSESTAVAPDGESTRERLI
jgi:hypothetical protein